MKTSLKIQLQNITEDKTKIKQNTLQLLHLKVGIGMMIGKRGFY